MLFADKQALETELKVSLLAIRERELDLYTDNLRNIGAQAALLAGFAYSALTFEVMDLDAVCTMQKVIEGVPCAKDSMTNEVTIALYQLVGGLAMMLNVAAAFGSTVSAMLGPGLALRGQDGAMDQAVEGLALEYRACFLLFMGGIFAYYLCFCIYLLVDYDRHYGWSDFVLHLILLVFLLYFIRSTFGTMKRIYKKFRLPPEVAVAGNFDPNAPSIRGRSPEAEELDRLCVNKRWQAWPRRQYLYAMIFMDEFLGISHKVFQERYQKSAQARGHARRPNNQMLHSIIRYLERPDRPPGRRRGSTMFSSESVAHCSEDKSSASVVSSTSARGRSGGGGGGRWWRRGGGEEKLTLAGSVVTELELSSMSPSDYLNSGAISPADSAEGERV